MPGVQEGEAAAAGVPEPVSAALGRLNQDWKSDKYGAAGTPADQKRDSSLVEVSLNPITLRGEPEPYNLKR